MLTVVSRDEAARSRNRPISSVESTKADTLGMTWGSSAGPQPPDVRSRTGAGANSYEAVFPPPPQARANPATTTIPLCAILTIPSMLVYLGVLFGIPAR